MWRLAALMVVIVLGCGAPERSVDEAPPSRSGEGETPPADSAGGAPVSCGRHTCGPREYCYIQCLCCGTRIPEPDEVSASYECVALPAGCDVTRMCGCPGIQNGLCDPAARTVSTPCA